MMALMSPRLWIALGLAAVLAFTHFAANRAGAARVRGQWDAALLVQKERTIEDERIARKESLRRVEAQAKEAQNGQDRIDAAVAAATTADRGRERMRGELSAFVARNRGGADHPAAASAGAPASTALDLLADLFTGADARAGELAKALDRSYAAGVTCERSYNTLTTGHFP